MKETGQTGALAAMEVPSVGPIAKAVGGAVAVGHPQSLPATSSSRRGFLRLAGLGASAATKAVGKELGLPTAGAVLASPAARRAPVDRRAALKLLALTSGDSATREAIGLAGKGGGAAVRLVGKVVLG